MHFIKLNKKLDVFYQDDGYFSSYAINGKGIFYHNVSNYDRDVVLSMIPEEYRNDFIVRLLKINASIPPHTDSYVKCGINIYVNPGRCETKFYSKDESVDGHRLTTQTTGRTFAESELQLVGSFVAEPGDIYLLNILEPHSIKNLDPVPLERTVIVIQSDKHDFNRVADMLKSTNWI